MKILIVFLQWAFKTRLRALVSMLVLLVIVGWVAALVQNAMKTPEQRAAERTHQQEAAVAATVERDRKDSESWAKAACQVAVKNRLKAPSTASFVYDDVAGIKDGKAYVVGSVDAQNAFGAVLRNRYVCELIPRNGGRWNVVAVQFP